MITIIAGGRNSGKTTYIENIIQNLDSVYGYISEKIIKENRVIGYSDRNIHTGEKNVLLHETLEFDKQFSNKRFNFDINRYEICCRNLIKASESYNNIIIDEIGKLELEKKLGFYNALQELFKKDINIFVTIRNNLLPAIISFLEKYNKHYNVVNLKSVGAVILASGDSKRFKNGNKLLYKYKGYTLFERVLKKVIQSNCFSEVVVVSRYEDIKNIAKNYKEVIYINNKNATEGISCSIKLGTSYLKNKVDGYMFIQADQIFIRKSTLFNLVQAFKDNEVEVVMPKYGYKLASPKIISSNLTEKLLQLTGDEGAKGIVRNYKSTLSLPIKDEEELLDVDTVEDLQKLDNYL